MYRRQIEKLSDDAEVNGWVNSNLYEAMAAYLVASLMGIPQEVLDKPKRRTEHAEFVNYTHDRMVMLAHARFQLQSPTDDPRVAEAAWVGVVRDQARKAPARLKSLSYLPYVTSPEGESSILAVKRTETKREDFREMWRRLKDREGQDVEFNQHTGSNFALSIRRGDLFLPQPSLHGQMVIFRKHHRKFLTRILSGEPSSIIHPPKA